MCISAPIASLFPSPLRPMANANRLAKAAAFACTLRQHGATLAISSRTARFTILACELVSFGPDSMSRFTFSRCVPARTSSIKVVHECVIEGLV